jgi:TatD DNase family protein
VTDEVKKKQKRIFNEQIALAAELEKPLIIHSRPSKGSQDANRDLIEILKEAKQKYPNVRGDIHFFVGGVEEARELVELGFTLSFTAVITFARDYDEVIRSVPLASILSETDAPYVAPEGRRGKRNDPLAVEDVAAKIAEIRHEDPEMVRNALVENAKRLFALS